MSGAFTMPSRNSCRGNTMTLLAHLAPKMKDPTENPAVEALGYILRRKSARKAPEAILSSHGHDLGEVF